METSVRVEISGRKLNVVFVYILQVNSILIRQAFGVQVRVSTFYYLDEHPNHPEFPRMMSEEAVLWQKGLANGGALAGRPGEESKEVCRPLSKEEQERPTSDEFKQEPVSELRVLKMHMLKTDG